MPATMGMKFQSDVAGTVSSVRFYKAAGNSGTHIGMLYSGTGALLAQATFSGETASGWQQVDFSAPVAIAANTTYIAAYFSTVGCSLDASYFTAAGVDNAPLHALRSGVDGSNGVYEYAVAPQFPTLSWSDSNYWVDVVFSPAAPPPSVSIWSSSTVPVTPFSPIPQPVVVGVKFRSDVSGSVNGIRFYKGTGNNGTHIGLLYTGAGALLAQATFSGETASGWQQVNFSSPVSIAADTTYVAGYFTTMGLALDVSYFTSTGFDNAPLHALRSGVDGGNAVYLYSDTPQFPFLTWSDSNYWVDLAFTADSGPPPSAPTPVTVSPSGTSGMSQVFTAGYADPVAYTNLTESQILVQSSTSAAYSCNARYYAGSFWLRNDTDTAWLGPVTAQIPRENLQCALSLVPSGSNGSGITLTVSYPLTFKSAFAGGKNIYLRTANASADSGWIWKGNWTVAPVVQPPVNVSITPPSGTGTVQTFAAKSSSPNGYPAISQVQIVFGYAARMGGSCYVIYTPPSNTVVVVNDDGTTDAQHTGVLGTGAPIENSQCRLDLASSSAVPSFNDLTVNLALTFKAGLPGPQNTFLSTADENGLMADFAQMGTWTTTTVNGQGPTAVSVTPNSGTGMSQAFTYVGHSVNGWDYVAEMWVEINSSVTHTNSCYIYFNRWEGVWLFDNDGGMTQHARLGEVGAILQNSQCVLDAEHSSTGGSGTDQTLTLALSFQSGFTGAKSNYLNVTDRSGVNVSGWQSLGTWTVGGGALNLALGKGTAQSSTYYGTTGAEKAVDGSTNGNFNNGSVSHTNYEPSPWWQVDFGAPATVNSVVLWNRTDCCGERLGDYWIFISNTPFGPSDTPATLQNRAGTWSSHQTTIPNPSATITVPGAQGQYLRVQLTGSGMLSMAEVQVYGSTTTGTVAAPTFSPAQGTYTTALSVSITTTTPGASIRYTTDGTTPSATVGTLYGGPITVSGSGTIRAIAFVPGWTDSTVASALYTITGTVATPTFSPAAGTYATAQSVAIGTTTPGASIRYTTDGTTPSATVGTLYGGPITVSVSSTVKAIAYESGWTDSTVASATYTITVTVAVPTFSPAAGTYATAQSVTISTATPGASIRYTTDGTTPSATVGTLYGGPITVSASGTVRAIAYESGWTDSTVASATYTITGTVAAPTFNPAAGTYSTGQSVTISTATPGASIRYTTDGATPSPTVGTLYSGPVAVSSTTTIRAIAYQAGWTDSTVAPALYTISPPDFSVVVGTSAPVIPGGTASYTVTVTPSNGFTGTVILSATNLPAGVSCPGASVNVSGTGQFTGQLALTTTAGTQAITSQFTVTGTSGALSHYSTGSLSVQDYSIGISPGTANTTPGGNASYNVTVTPINGFNGTVSFNVPGASAQFSPTSLTGGGSTVMTISTSSGAAAGTTNLSLNATSGALNRPAQFALAVQDFGIAVVNPNPASVRSGGNVSYSITVAPQNGFSGPISFSVSGQPSGASVNFSPPTLTGGGTTVLSVSTATTTLASTLNLIISATAPGSTPKTAAATLVVAETLTINGPLTGSTIPLGSAVQLSATVTGAADQTVCWQFLPGYGPFYLPTEGQLMPTGCSSGAVTYQSNIHVNQNSFVRIQAMTADGRLSQEWDGVLGNCYHCVTIARDRSIFLTIRRVPCSPASRCT